MKVWLTGASGTLGKAMTKLLDGRGTSYVATDSNLDIRNRKGMLEHALDEQPTHIINCAAFTRVDDAERLRDEAHEVNTQGPANVAHAALAVGASLLHFSTDYIFDGRSDVAYGEDAPARPLNTYGETKLNGEKLLRRLADEHPGLSLVVVRTSWLFGDHGPSFVKTMLDAMARREMLSVVNDQWGRPTYAHDLAQTCMQLIDVFPRACAAAGSDHTLHYANSGATTWHGFATGILSSAHRAGWPLVCKRIEPTTTAQVARPARRPTYSVLDTRRIESLLGRAPRSWQAALAEHLDVLRGSRGQEARP